MSETLDRISEITKLARLLGVEATELDSLESVPSEELNEFRTACTDRLFAGDAGRLHRVAAASKLVPVALTVRISQLAFGPVLCAATAGLLDPPHAVRVASRVPTPFLADIAIHLDPRRAASVIAAMPAPIVVDVALELLARQEYVTLGRFVNYLPRATLAAAVPKIEDESDLLRVAFVMEGKSSLDDLLDIARPRIQQLIDAAHRDGMWPEALDLIAHLSLDNRVQLADVAAAQDPAVVEALVRAVDRLSMWDALLPVVAVMSPQALARFATLPALLDPGLLDSVVTAALGGGLWLELLPLARALPPEAVRVLAARAATEDDTRLAELAGSAHEAGLWPAMLTLAAGFDDAARARLAALPLLGREEVLRAAVGAAAGEGLWDPVLSLAEALPDEVKARIVVAIGDLADEQILAALQAARPGDTVPALVVQRASALGRADVLERLAAGSQQNARRRPRPGRRTTST